VFLNPGPDHERAGGLHSPGSGTVAHYRLGTLNPTLKPNAPPLPRSQVNTNSGPRYWFTLRSNASAPTRCAQGSKTSSHGCRRAAAGTAPPPLPVDREFGQDALGTCDPAGPIMAATVVDTARSPEQNQRVSNLLGPAWAAAHRGIAYYRNNVNRVMHWNHRAASRVHFSRSLCGFHHDFGNFGN
jgi:hypothetical protein